MRYGSGYVYLPPSSEKGFRQASSVHTLTKLVFVAPHDSKASLKTVKTKLILIYLGEDLKDTPGSRAESVRESNENQRASQLQVMARPDSRAGNCPVGFWKEIGVGLRHPWVEKWAGHLSPRNSRTASVWNPLGNLSRGLVPTFIIYSVSKAMALVGGGSGRGISKY